MLCFCIQTDGVVGREDRILLLAGVWICCSNRDIVKVTRMVKESSGGSREVGF